MNLLHIHKEEVTETRRYFSDKQQCLIFDCYLGNVHKNIIRAQATLLWEY